MKADAKIELTRANIVTLEVDAIVNAANTSLLGGGGVDGAIHRAAGPDLLVECYTLGDCPTGQARLTHGYRLPARYVIHAVGPVWHDGKRSEAKLLASCYQWCFRLATERGVRSIAFPAISCGAYGYPISDAALIAVRETRQFLEKANDFEKVVFSCFGDDVFAAYEAALAGSSGE
jgi:O-acetyl-ADP-ribose deacetylase (regulator of RNase III)